MWLCPTKFKLLRIKNYIKTYKNTYSYDKQDISKGKTIILCIVAFQII